VGLDVSDFHRYYPFPLLYLYYTIRLRGCQEKF
jgi:hypothetical protein